MPFIDTQYATEALRQLNNAHKRSLIHQSLHQQADLDTEEIIGRLQEKDYAYIELQSIVKQRFYYHLARAYVARDGERAEYWLYLAIEPLLEIKEIISLLKKYYGNNYPLVKQRLQQLATILNQANYHLNNYDEKKLRDGDIGTPAYNKTIETLQKIPLLDETLWQVFGIITQHTSIGNTTVPNSALQVASQAEKKITYQEERKTTTDTVNQ